MLRDWARAEPEVGGRQLADSLLLDGRQLEAAWHYQAASRHRSAPSRAAAAWSRWVEPFLRSSGLLPNQILCLFPCWILTIAGGAVRLESMAHRASAVVRSFPRLNRVCLAGERSNKTKVEA